MELGFHPFLISENYCENLGRKIRESVMAIVKIKEEGASSRWLVS
jgi:hypothetical protein